MKIVLAHNAVIPPQSYGGTERVVYWLAKGLHELGHEPILIAAPGSRLDFAEVIECGDFSQLAQRVPAHAEIIHVRNTPQSALPKPFLVTIDGIGKPGETFHPNTVFVSKSHAALHGSTHYVHNGIDVRDYRVGKKENFAVFLAKASWDVKNLAGAIEVARHAGWRIEVLGSRDWMKCLPEFRGVKYRGMVGDAEKREILSRARALIFPVRWHEPFGLAITEALASGCFVLGTPYGALPEIITPEVGKLSNKATELAQELRKPERYIPENCRERVIQDGFTHLDMARGYLRYYERLLAHGNLEEKIGLQSSIPSTQARESKLLAWN